MAGPARVSVVTPARATAVLALSAVLFGAMAVVARTATAHISASQVAMFRFLVGLAGMLVMIAARPSWWVATRPGLLFARGLFGGMSVLGYFYAIQHISTGAATLLNYTFPVWAAVFAAIFLRERITPRMATGMALSLAGLAIVVGPSQLALAGGGSALVGLALGFGSSVSGGVATTVVRLLRRTDSAPAIFTAFCATGFVLSAPLAWVTWKPVPDELWPRLVLIGVLALCAQLMFTWAFRYVGAGQGGMTTQLTVIASYGLAWLFLDEPVSTSVALGAVVVITGVLLVSTVRVEEPDA